jgi:iron complex outermembrane receptor protein
MTLPSAAQEILGPGTETGISANRQIYSQAESEYEIGRIEEALTLLNHHIDKFEGNIKQSAYRLMALCCYGLDKDGEAELLIRLLLKENPYYTPMAQDPIRFAECINNIKAGQTATVYTASNQAEKLEETPVPMTLITEEMIRVSGARNLKELLVTYVPGMTNVECNEEMNVAMHGVYSSGQEKILIMLNGHRLNSYCTNVAQPDFSISLEKIKQIEVLRGPASSLYGGVALTAVINIITKSGHDINGFSVQGGIGNYGQLRGDVLFGNHYMDFDIAAWASIYNAEGEKINIPVEQQVGVIPIEGDIIVGGFNRKPSYDIGLVMTWKNLSFMHNTNFSKTVAPYSLSYSFAPYDYDRYRTLDGNKPGFAFTAHHTNLTYRQPLGSVNLSAMVTYDTESQNRYQVMNDYFPADMLDYYYIPYGTETKVYPFYYTFQYNNWLEQNIAATINAEYSYKMNSHHSGTILFGAQYNFFEVSESRNIEGDEGGRILFEYDDTKNLATGRERSANSYIQIKHRWDDFILNAGIRYDYKKRSNDHTINEYSPRVALIYIRPKYNFKICYSKSFVDAPYYYRNNTLDTYKGGADLLSEYLNSWQFAVGLTDLVPHLNVEVSSFFNKATNLIYASDMFYDNSGQMKNWGIEISGSYLLNKFQARFNVEYQKLISAENYTASEKKIHNIPEWSGNFNGVYNFTKNFSVIGHLNFFSKQESLEMKFGEPDVEIELPARATVDAGVSYKLNPVTLKFNMNNILNTTYDQGGASIAPIRQRGRWFMFSVKYNIF